MKRRFVTLRGRLFLLAAAAIVPLALMAGVGLLALHKQQVRQAEQAALEISRALLTGVDAELGRSVSVLEAMTASPLLDSGDLHSFYNLSRRIAAARPQWVAVVLATPDGTPAFNTRFLFGGGIPAIQERASFDRVAAQGVPAIGDAVKGVEGNVNFAVRVPVLREGKVRYVLSAVVRPEGILEVVRRQHLPADWVVSVFDGRNTRVARSRQHEQFLGHPPSPSLLAMMRRAGNEGTGLTAALEGDRIYTAYTRSPATGWSVAIGLPPSFVEEGALRSLAAFGAGILLSLLLGIAAALLIARRIARPIGELGVAAQALGRREPLVPPATRIREIRQVADSLVAAADERARGEAERERLLAREQHARAIAEEANRAKDEFLAMLGHELRNPLGAIANASQVLAHPRADPEAAAQAKGVIARQVAHLSRMTDDLLDAARAMTGKIVLQRHPLDLAQAVGQLAPGFGARHRVLTRLEPVWVDADATRIEQIAVNLLGNAVKYTPAGGTITASVAREGGEAVLRVADDGAGMPPELLARVFEPFVQGERSLDRAYGGLGIGLTLVRRLAELHGGSASAQSDGPGRGSTFTVRLPAIETPAARAEERTAGASAPRRVLLVEDNADARETLRRLLELDGHAVAVARDGHEALAAWRASPPDVALVDIGLPGLDGYEVARRMRASQAPGIPRPRLVAVTGYGLQEDRRRTREAGFDDHLVKPVSAEMLRRALG